MGQSIGPRPAMGPGSLLIILVTWYLEANFFFLRLNPRSINWHRLTLFLLLLLLRLWVVDIRSSFIPDLRLSLSDPAQRAPRAATLLCRVRAVRTVEHTKQNAQVCEVATSVCQHMCSRTFSRIGTLDCRGQQSKPIAR